LFYRAIKCQDNLDYMFPTRNHPIRGKATPEAINIIRLFRIGMSQKEISVHLNKDYKKIQAAVIRSGVYRVNRIKYDHQRGAGRKPKLTTNK